MVDLICAIAMPLLAWFRQLRMNQTLMMFVSLGVTVGMARVVMGLRRTHLPSAGPPRHMLHVNDPDVRGARANSPLLTSRRARNTLSLEQSNFAGGSVRLAD
jgi:hypothetical protein